MSSFQDIAGAFKKKKFAPIYWLQGEEPFFMDQLMHQAEHKLLNETEASFNLTIFYGKDADWSMIVNACRKHPMFGTFQVVLLKEAQMMRDLVKLEPYVHQPLATTVFVVSYKGKHPDKRTGFFKALQKQAVIFDSAKLREDKIQPWIEEQISERSCTIDKKAVAMIADFIGNDLSRIVTELDKLLINKKGDQHITAADVEEQIGISREYNAFELQAALAQKQWSQAMRIIAYFEANPKAGPIQMVIPALYGFFSKMYAVYGEQKMSEKDFKQLFYFNPVAIAQAQTAMKLYGFTGVEKIILLLHQYNLKSIGIGDTGTESASLLRELTIKLMTI